MRYYFLTLFFTLNFSTFICAQSQSSPELSTIGFYQKYLSNIRGQSCPMYPSCSNYGYQVFRDQGILKGFLRTPDRLLRCGHEHHLYNITLTDKGFRLLDSPFDVVNDTMKWINRRYSPFRDFNYRNPELDLAIKLIQSGLYASAIVPLNRIILNGEEPSVEVYVNYLVCLRALNKHELAIYEHGVNFPKKVADDPEILLRMARIAKDLANLSLELGYLQRMDTAILTEKNLDLHVYGLRVLLGEEDTVLGELDQNKYPSLREDILALTNAKYKKKLLGGVFSVLPGGGYLYAKQGTTALSSFVLTTILSYASYDSFKNNNNGMGILSGIFAASFYISNITGGVKSVERYNSHKKKKLENELKLNY